MESNTASTSHFYAYISRMKLIQRWSLMRNVRIENVQEHSLQVAMIAHALGLIKNKKFGGHVNPERLATLSIFHDATEVLTGDLPTPVKYFSTDLRSAYKEMEHHAESEILSMLPEEFREEYTPLFTPNESDKQHWALIKAADIICAYIKCLEEITAGNKEFIKAKQTVEDKLKESDLPEVHYFMDHFTPSFALSLDEMAK